MRVTCRDRWATLVQMTSEVKIVMNNLKICSSKGIVQLSISLPKSQNEEETRWWGQRIIWVYKWMWASVNCSIRMIQARVICWNPRYFIALNVPIQKCPERPCFRDWGCEYCFNSWSKQVENRRFQWIVVCGLLLRGLQISKSRP